MVTFKDFCMELADIKVEASGVRSADDFKAESLPPKSILIGCGAKFGILAPSVLLLDNKGSARRFGLKEDYRCVTRLVNEAPPGFFEKWPLWPEKPLNPQDFLKLVTLVVEDASPDSTWGLLLLLARIADCDLSPIMDDWLPVIERWEVAGMVDDPFIEWPSLASALAHSHFPGGGQPRIMDYATAWTDTLNFAAGSLARTLSPIAIKNCNDWNLWHRAYTALKQEEQAYHDWLSHALTVQLSLPMEKTNNRRLLVDAIFIVEDFPAGAGKVFYRNDRVNSPLKEGFTLAAHYRPEKCERVRRDITITLDARKGVHLLDLWFELERRECNAWKMSPRPRPAENPRSDLAQYLGISNPWTQPWYIDRTMTIVAAPNAIEDIGPGSLLSWEDVKDAIWTVYNPLIGVMVTKENKDVQLLHLTPEYIPECAKRLLIADWPRDPQPPSPRSLSDAPVVERVIATLIDRRTIHERGIDSLPEPGSWERVKLDAGFAIVTQNGLFVLNDWHPSPKISPAEIHKAFCNANDLDRELTVLENNVVKQFKKLISSLPDGANREVRKGTPPRLASWLDVRRNTLIWKEPKGLVAVAAAWSVELAVLRAETVSVSPNSDIRRVAEALDRRWALTSRLNLLEKQTKTIRDSVKELGDAQVRRIITFVTVYGFAFYVASGVAEHFATAIAAHWPIFASDNKTSQPLWWLWWACFLIIGVLSVLVLNLLIGRDAPRKDKEGENRA